MNFVEHLDDLWRGIVFSAAAVAIRHRGVWVAAARPTEQRERSMISRSEGAQSRCRAGHTKGGFRCG